jgi:F0F1-type ATP synthase membrane subunit c/vacuolar-type H+-ATPase subunit K
MASSRPSPSEGADLARQRRTWLILVLALAASIVAYGLIAFALLHRSPARAPAASFSAFRVMLYGLSLVILAMALAPIRRWREATLPTAQFRVASLRTVVLLESVALYGLLLSLVSRTMSDLWLLAGVSLATILVVVIPAGLGYWRRREEAASPPSPIRPG